MIGAVVALKETPYIPPLSEVCPIGDTSSPQSRGLIGRTTGRAALQESIRLNEPTDPTLGLEHNKMSFLIGF